MPSGQAHTRDPRPRPRYNPATATRGNTRAPPAPAQGLMVRIGSGRGEEPRQRGGRAPRATRNAQRPTRGHRDPFLCCRARLCPAFRPHRRPGTSSAAQQAARRSSARYPAQASDPDGTLSTRPTAHGTAGAVADRSVPSATPCRVLSSLVHSWEGLPGPRVSANTAGGGRTRKPL